MRLGALSYIYRQGSSCHSPFSLTTPLTSLSESQPPIHLITSAHHVDCRPFIRYHELCRHGPNRTDTECAQKASVLYD